MNLIIVTSNRLLKLARTKPNQVSGSHSTRTSSTGILKFKQIWNLKSIAIGNNILFDEHHFNLFNHFTLYCFVRFSAVVVVMLFQVLSLTKWGQVFFSSMAPSGRLNSFNGGNIFSFRSLSSFLPVFGVFASHHIMTAEEPHTSA